MRSTKRKRTTTISDSKEVIPESKKRFIVGLNENGKLVKQENNNKCTSATSASMTTTATTLLSSQASTSSLKENKSVLVTELEEEEIRITTTTTTSTAASNEQKCEDKEEENETSTTLRRRFKSKKSNLKNLQNKKLSSISAAAAAQPSVVVTQKSAFSTLDNIITPQNGCKSVTTVKTTATVTVVLPTAAAAEPIEYIPIPKLTWALNTELWSLMKNKCKNYKHEATYLRKHPGLEANMRSVLLDWIMEIAHAYRLHRETFHLAVEYIDRFMSVTERHKVDRLQLIGITALFIASKVEEIYPPKLRDFAYHMDDYSTDNEEAISQFELYMLKALQWQISPLTLNTWLNIYLQITNKNVVLQNGGSTVCNTSILLPKELHEDYVKAISLIDLCAFDIESLKYDYSQIAACAMCLTIKPSDAALTASGYKLAELQACLSWMSPYAEIIQEYEETFKLRKFSEIDADDSHNIQLHFSFIDYMKEAKLRKTPAKQTTTALDELSFVLTPPDSNKKKN